MDSIHRLPRVLVRSALIFACAVLLRHWAFATAEPPSADASPRAALSLDGIWDFATDPDRVGEAESWYLAATPLPRMPRPGYAATADGKIRVPGVWDNQGYGTETDKVRHNFVGLGWYRREVVIPESWAGRRLFLRVAGIHRSAKAWIDGRPIGEHVGYLSAFESEITPLVEPGKTATLAIAVDSRQRSEVDALFGASDLADYMDVAWGGIQGHVTLEARSPVWLGDLFVKPRVDPRAASATAVLLPVPDARGGPGSALDPLAGPDAPDAIRLEILDAAGRRVAERTVPRGPDWKAGGLVGVEVSLPGAALWSPDTPILHTARLSLLREGRPVDALETRFGMREFRIDGRRILLNGETIFLRGYGDDHIYPVEMARPTGKDVYLRRLRTIKSYGFNHVRHHSTILPPEYYDACDEAGILCTAEFPIAYQPFLPGGDTWKRNAPPGTDPATAVETHLREWDAAIRTHRNHPSIFAWVMGNELWDGVPLRVDFARIARALDPTRPFADSDGVTEMWGHILDPANDRDTLDLYFLMFDVGTNPLDNPGKFQTREPKKPIISHESGNYVTFSRPDLADLFRHNFKPFWLSPGVAKLEKLGLLEEAGLWAQKSERLYFTCHKHNLEALRKNPFISGYHWWLFQDYWTSSNGLVDHYFRPKSIGPEEVLRINNDIVLLQDGLDLTCRGKGRIEARLLVSNFSPSALDAARVEWSVDVGGVAIASGASPATIGSGAVGPVQDLRLDLPDVRAPDGLRLRAKLVVGARTIENEWTSRLYPAAPAPPKLALPAFADAALLPRWERLGLRPIPTSGELPGEAVYLAALLDKRLLAAVERGARAVLLDETRDVLPSRRITYRTTWWKAGDNPEANHCGTFVNDHPATRAMAPDGWCDAGWFHLLEGASKYVIEDVPGRPRVIVRAIPSLALVEDAAVLFEVGIGKGSLIVSGLNHERALGRPEDEWLVARLLEHAASSPPPPVAWPASFVRAAEPPPPGPYLAGFRKVLRNEGEEGTWHSYREDNVKFFICRQTKPGNELEWEAAPAPAQDPGADPASAAPITYAFAGGLGYASEPATEGFAFLLDGVELLRFDLAAKYAPWKSADGRATLRFVPRRHLPHDQLGIFYLTVTHDLLRAGTSPRLAVRSLGTGSRRWFGLNEYSEGLPVLPGAARAEASAGAGAAAPEFRALRRAERVVALRGGGFFPVMVALGDGSPEGGPLPAGSLGAVVRGGAGHLGKGGRLDFIRSEDGGRTWSAPTVAADGEWDDRNPALGRMADGTLILAYAEARSYRPDGTFDLAAGPYLPRIVTSPDSGKTWSAPRDFDAPFPNPSPYGKILVLRDGTAVLFVYQMPSNAAAILRSRDSGTTWGDPSPLPGHDETQLAELPDGKLLSFTRIEEEGEHGLLLAESADGGRTWGAPRRLLKSRQWPFDATVLRSGSLLLSYGSRRDHFGAGVLLSRDGGRTWDADGAVLVGWDSRDVDTGYPSTVQLPDGTIVTMYYAAGTRASQDVQAIVVRYSEDELVREMEAVPPAP